MKHKHAELIKAWADGAEIQFYTVTREWIDIDNPDWKEGFRYRIKPKPDVVDYLITHIHLGVNEKDIHVFKFALENDANLKIIYDGETGKLKSAEVL